MRMQRGAGMYIDHIHDRLPLSAKLSDLFVSDIQQDGYGMFLSGRIGVNRIKIESPARNCIQNAHQRALGVAIADVEDLHVRPPERNFDN